MRIPEGFFYSNLIFKIIVRFKEQQNTFFKMLNNNKVDKGLIYNNAMIMQRVVRVQK